MKHQNKFILASKSPRRRQLLTEAGYSFEVKTVDFEEVLEENSDISRAVERLALDKNKAHQEMISDSVILTADTVVVFNDMIIGKPKDEEDIKKTLNLLSGKIHQVITGVCVSSPSKTCTISAKTDVSFKSLTASEIDFYIENQPPFDKAGSYGIQDWIGLVGVEWIKGCFRNVIGLPVSEVYALLAQEFNIFPSKIKQ